VRKLEEGEMPQYGDPSMPVVIIAGALGWLSTQSGKQRSCIETLDAAPSMRCWGAGHMVQQTAIGTLWL
jgi:hypothetical protein